MPPAKKSLYHLALHTAMLFSAMKPRKAIPQVVGTAKDNMAGVVRANGSMSPDRCCEGEITSSKGKLWTNWKCSCTLNS